MNGNEENLDRLLSAPLAAVADDGFSARVTARMAAAGASQTSFETALFVAAAGALLIVLSMAGLPEWLQRVSLSLANSLPLAVAAFALALTALYTRVLAD